MATRKMDVGECKLIISATQKYREESDELKSIYDDALKSTGKTKIILLPRKHWKKPMGNGARKMAVTH